MFPAKDRETDMCKTSESVCSVFVCVERVGSQAKAVKNILTGRPGFVALASPTQHHHTLRTRRPTRALTPHQCSRPRETTPPRRPCAAPESGRGTQKLRQNFRDKKKTSLPPRRVTARGPERGLFFKNVFWLGLVQRLNTESSHFPPTGSCEP